MALKPVKPVPFPSMKDTLSSYLSYPDINDQIKAVPWDNNPLLEEASMAVVGMNSYTTTASHTLANASLTGSLQSIPEQHIVTSVATTKYVDDQIEDYINKPPAIIAGEGLMIAYNPGGSATISLTAPIKGADLDQVKAKVIDALLTNAEGKKVAPSVAALQAVAADLTLKNAELQSMITQLQTNIASLQGSIYVMQNQIDKLKTTMTCHTHPMNLNINGYTTTAPSGSSYDANNWLT